MKKFMIMMVVLLAVSICSAEYETLNYDTVSNPTQLEKFLQNPYFPGVSYFGNDFVLDGTYDIQWDKSENTLEVLDNATIAVGTGDDWKITHNGTDTIITGAAVFASASPFAFEGSSVDANRTTFTFTNPTASRTMTFPDGSGTFMLSSLATNAVDAANSVTGASNAIVYEGSSADGNETSIKANNPTADNILTFPDDSGWIAYIPDGNTTSAADSLAIPITHAIVVKTTGADAEALTLANGENGQLLTITLGTDGGGDGTLTPTTKTGFATIVFADAGDTATLFYVNDVTGWILTGCYGLTAQPVVTK